MWSKYPEIDNELKLVDKFIHSNTISKNKLLSTVVAGLVEAGGKRIRPAFVIIASRFGSYDRKKVLPAAGALEILHTATLIHDDVIDCSTLRRGRPTLSGKYGTDLAIYTGDFLFTKAVLMLSKSVPVKYLDIVAKSIKTICEGEVYQYQEKFKINTSVPSYLKKISRKTAVLFGTSCALGAFLGKCSKKDARSIAKFGFYYGMAFQIRDDLNDLLASSNMSDKPVGKDIKEGVFTLPVILAIKENDAVMAEFKAYAERKEVSQEEVARLIGLVKETKGIEKSEAFLKRYIERGLEELKHLPDGSLRNVLKDLINALKY